MKTIAPTNSEVYGSADLKNGDLWYGYYLRKGAPVVGEEECIPEDAFIEKYRRKQRAIRNNLIAKQTPKTVRMLLKLAKCRRSSCKNVDQLNVYRAAIRLALNGDANAALEFLDKHGVYTEPHWRTVYRRNI